MSAATVSGHTKALRAAGLIVARLTENQGAR